MTFRKPQLSETLCPWSLTNLTWSLLIYFPDKAIDCGKVAFHFAGRSWTSFCGFLFIRWCHWHENLSSAFTVPLNHFITSDFPTETALDSSVFSLIFSSFIFFSLGRGFIFLLHLKAPKAPMAFPFSIHSFIQHFLSVWFVWIWHSPSCSGYRHSGGKSE